MKRLLGIGLVVFLTACGGAGHATPRGDAHPTLQAIKDARRQVALRKAGNLLGRVELPAGAVRLPRMPIHDLGMTTREAGGSIDFITVERVGFWRVPRSVGSVMRFALAHPVPGFTSPSSGQLQDGSQYRVFYGPESSARRAVSVSAVNARHSTYVRVEAAATWIYPRSPKEALPAGVSEIDIHGGVVDRRLTDPSTVAQVVRWFGEPTVSPPHAYAVSCMIGSFIKATFTFRSASGKVLARAIAPSGPASACDPIMFYVHGRAETPLVDTGPSKDAFVPRVERLLGVCFGAGPGGGHVPSPVCNRAWAGHVAKQLLHRFRLPPGAQALTRGPHGDGGLLRSPQMVSGGLELVDQHRFWKVRLSLAAAEAFVEHEHHPQQTAVSSVGGPGVPSNRTVTFTYAPRNGLIASHGLEVTFVTLPHGWTGIRADAQVVWIYPRTYAQMAPANTRVIEVRAGSTTRRITDYRTVDKILFRFGRLEVVQPGTMDHCPGFAPHGPTVTIEFHAVNPTVTARAVAHGTSFSTACDPIVFTVHGRSTQLVGGDFARWLEGVLGVRFR